MSRVDHAAAPSPARAGRARGVRARARRLPGLARRRRRAAGARVAGGARLRDGARAAGLPARLQPRSAARRDRRARCSRAPPRCRPTSASASIWPRSPRCSTTTTTTPPRRRLGELLRLEPRDALALQVAHSLDYVTGDVARHERARRGGAAGLVERPARLPRRARDARLRPRGERRATTTPRRARPRRARARSARRARAPRDGACLRDDRPRRGGRALAAPTTPRAGATDTVVATHCWWHLALFQLALGRPDRALDTLRPPHPRRLLGRRRRPDRRVGAAVAHRSSPAATPAARWLRARRRVGAAHRRRASAASTTCTRCWPSSARATGGARAPRARPAERRSRGRHATARRRALLGLPRAAPWSPSAAATTCWRSRCSPACRRRRTASAAATRSATCST